MIRCNDGSLYTGITADINRRLKEHNSGKGSKYVRSRLPATLVYLESKLYSKSEALKREIEIKKMSKQRKEDLVNEQVCRYCK